MEVCFQVPETAAKSGQLTALFAELEKVHDVMGVSSYGISDTSLEEVRTLLLVLVLVDGGVVLVLLCYWDMQVWHLGHKLREGEKTLIVFVVIYINTFSC